MVSEFFDNSQGGHESLTFNSPSPVCAPTLPLPTPVPTPVPTTTSTATVSVTVVKKNGSAGLSLGKINDPRVITL